MGAPIACDITRVLINSNGDIIQFWIQILLRSHFWIHEGCSTLK